MHQRKLLVAEVETHVSILVLAVCQVQLLSSSLRL